MRESIEPIELTPFDRGPISDKRSSRLIPEKKEHREGDTGCAEIEDTERSSTEDLIDSRTPGKQHTETGFKKNTSKHDLIECGVSERSFLALATDDVRPLNQYDGNEIGALSVFKGFSCVADVPV